MGYKSCSLYCMIIAAVAFCALVLAPAKLLHAQIQSATPAAGDPVDRAVVDVDPLSAQLRHVDRGLSHAAPFQYNFRQVAGAQHMAVNPEIAGQFPGRTRQFYYESPGVRAWMDRPTYAVRESADFFDDRMTTDSHPIFDNEFVAMAPADTVYDLIPQPAFQPVSIPIITGADGQQFIQQIDPQPDFLRRGQLNTYVDIQPLDARIAPYRRPLEVMPAVPMQTEQSLEDKVRAIAYQQQRASQQAVSDARRDQWIRMRQELAAERGLVFDPETGQTRMPEPGEKPAATSPTDHNGS